MLDTIHAHAARPVSYTHLDVYKRQPQHLGKKDVLIINDKIVKIKDAGSISADGFLSETERINGCLLYTSRGMFQ